MGIFSEKLVVQSPLSPEQVRRVTKGFTETENYLCTYSSSGDCRGFHKMYHGFVSDHRFNVSRIQHYRGSVPLIVGQVGFENGQTMIHISITSNIMVMFFVGILFILTLSFVGWAIPKVFREPNGYQFLIWPVAMGIGTFFFWKDSKEERATDKVFFERIFKTPLDSE